MITVPEQHQPFGPHWVFREWTYAVLPAGSQVFPVFMRESLAGIETIFCDTAQRSEKLWYVHMDDLYTPVDYEFDSGLRIWHGKKLSEFAPLHTLAYTPLPKIEKISFQGRNIIGFSLTLADLVPYQ